MTPAPSPLALPDVAVQAPERLHPLHSSRSHARKRLPGLHSVQQPVSRNTLPSHLDLDAEHPHLAHYEDLWDLTAHESVAHAERLRALASWWPENAEELSISACDQVDLRLACALRTTANTAHRLLLDARRATTLMPATVERLASGELPKRWFDHALRRTTRLDEHSLRVFDEELATWDLRVDEGRFRRAVNALARHLLDVQEAVAPSAPPRRVEILPPDEDGMACLAIHGPAPEILSLGRRLDASARAVQRAQRHALANHDAGDLVSVAIPFDDGSVASSGQPMSLAALRYEILTRSVLDTGAVEVPAERFRINVTVPALGLLGSVDAPGMLDGIHPIPAPMARQLAGTSSTWYRILTDPSTGTFLPLPAERYTPTRAMLEHLRLRNPVCAAPGCTRATSWNAEMDHIEEFNHHHPAAGGPTSMENAHLLCWQHHQLKTAGLIDPVRLHGPRPASPPPSLSPDPSPPPRSGALPGPRPSALQPGATAWEFPKHPHTPTVYTTDEQDLITPWVLHEFERQQALIAARISAHTEASDDASARSVSATVHSPWDEPPPY